MELKTLIRALSDPRIYPHECNAVQMVETHISIVFLTGSYAYKVKKPVNFGFLDFSTVEKRRYNCEQELLRNQVFAPDIYVKVLGVEAQGDSFKFTDDLDRAAEFVVQMRQFPQEDLLSHQLENNSLSFQDAHAIGVDLAKLHQTLDVAPQKTKWGAPETVAYPINENFEQISPLVSQQDEKALLQEIQDWSQSQLGALTGIFQQRKQGGDIRACHGDLHLNNILWRQGQAIPFDCIEFNEEFRWIDVMSEIAFLLMDLEHQGQEEFANHCLNGYLEVSGDFEGLRLIKFYKVYRAMVRAKVAILRAQQGSLTPEEKQTTHQAFLSYLRLAKQTIKPNQPCLYITHGVSGSGKTTMARFVAGKLGAIHVRSDVERKRLFGYEPSETSQSGFDQGIYTKDATVQTFKRLESIAVELLGYGFSTIIDATFLKRSVREEFLNIARIVNVPFAVLDCAIDEETARKRVKARIAKGQDASEANLIVLENQLCNQDYLSPGEQRHVVVIDMAQPLEKIDLEKLVCRECLGD